MTRPYDVVFDHLFTRVDPETAHRAAFRAIRAATPVLKPLTPRRPVVSAMGLDFPGVLGLAAGFDKNAMGIDALAGLGFGFVEIGTVTGEAQPGNPRPRLARLPKDGAIVNRMGFNNDGAETVARRLRARGVVPGSVPLGINIGKTKLVPEDDQAAVVADHEKSTRLLAPYADYFVVNVSSPNTPGLRNLQSVERLQPLLAAVQRQAERSTSQHVPLLVKIAPDLADQDVLAVADMAVAMDLDGIIATNTTIRRDGLSSSRQDVEAAGGGGLSGAPLQARAAAVMRMLRDRVGPGLCLIGAGGIGDEASAKARLAAGADLLQAYTGFVYGGPSWPRRINKTLTPRSGTRR